MSAVLFGIAGKKEGAEGGINRDSIKKSCRAFQKIMGYFLEKARDLFLHSSGGCQVVQSSKINRLWLVLKNKQLV